MVMALSLQRHLKQKARWVAGLAGLSCLAAAAIATPVDRTLPAGIWQTRGYGSAFQVDPAGITQYEILGAQCLRQARMTPDQFSGGFGDWTSDTDASGNTWHLTVSGMTVDRLERLPQACASAGELIDRDPLRNFDFLWETFDTHYAFFATHGVDWQAVHERYRKRVAALPKDGDPFPILAEMLALLKDTHVRLSDGKRVAHVKKSPPIMQAGPQGPVLLDDHYLQKKLVAYLQGKDTPLISAAKEAGNGQIYYGRLKPISKGAPSFGYIAIFSMDFFGKGESDDTPLDTRVRSLNAAMDRVVTELQGVRGVVVDLRYNGGGEDSMALAIAGHFTNVARPAWTKRVYEKGKNFPVFAKQVQPWSGDRLPVPLAVLTGDFTVSAAETATMALRALPETVQIGQPTRGVLSDRLEKVLPNGWTFSLSNEVYTDPKGRVFEAIGITPDQLTPPTSPTDPDSVRFERDIDKGVAVLDRSGKT